jgi:uncharacterized membrane protein YccC
MTAPATGGEPAHSVSAIAGRARARVGAADPGLFALKNALRAAIVVPSAFAFSLVVIGDKQMSLFAAFGSVALLVFVDFGGSRRERLVAYLTLIGAGAGLIALGTLCSRAPWLATVAMALVGFTVLFAGVLSDYIAAAHSAALLTFVLGVMVPGGIDVIPMRLAGWGLAGALSVAATMLLWPERPREALRQQAAHAARALAALVEANAGEDPTACAAAGEDAHEATLAVRRRFLAMEHRPSGTSSRTAALARLVDGLGWLRAGAARRPALTCAQTPFSAERAELEGAVPAALRGVAARLDLGEERGPEHETDATRTLARLMRAHEGLGRAFMERAGRWAGQSDEAEATLELDEAYRLRQLSFGTLQTGRDALLACGEPAAGDPLQTRRAQAVVVGRLARTHASMRSAWFRNSVRGAAGLTLAVLVGQISNLQHSFWIVLGTLSVLRSTALATGSTIISALLGTLGGIITGGVLVAVLADHEAALWVVLPIAVLLAGYAPRAISFAAGQGAFSLVVLVLFNLLQPSGWKVGLVRLEDVAIGAGVSLLAGLLIWPRGAGAVLRGALGAAYARAAGYLEATIDTLLDDGGRAPPELAAREAVTAAQLLDVTVRDYLSERGSPRGSLDDLTLLVAGASRARRVARLLQSARAFARLAPVDPSLPRLARARESFEIERRALCDWYATLGASIAGASPAPAPQRIGAADTAAPLARVVLERTPGAHGLPPGLAIAWAHRHLRALAELEPALAVACVQITDRTAGVAAGAGDDPPVPRPSR